MMRRNLLLILSAAALAFALPGWAPVSWKWRVGERALDNRGYQ